MLPVVQKDLSKQSCLLWEFEEKKNQNQERASKHSPALQQSNHL